MNLENFLKILNDKFIKAALGKLVRRLLLFGGFKGWLLSFVATELKEEIMVPLAKTALIEAKFIQNEIKGELNAKSIIEARLESDPDAIDAASDDLFGRMRNS